MTQAAATGQIRFSRAGVPDGHPLMTVHQAARMLGCSDMTIRRRIDSRQFPAVRIGRKSMIPREFVEQLVAAAAAGQTVLLDEFTREWVTAHKPAGTTSPTGASK